MAGIYVHIPFCKQLCHYCGFHKSISQKGKGQMVECLVKELKMRKDYLNGEAIDTIYFGGGTPSIYNPDQIEYLIDSIYKLYQVNSGAEITLEANPDDLTDQYLQSLARGEVNRLSIGVQSFFDDDLKFMNRRHSAEQAICSIKRAQDAGFSNISVDQIYGVPGLSMEKWRRNLEIVFDLQIQHISSYCLMYDPNTVFTHRMNKGQIEEMDEDKSLEQYKLLIQEAKRNGFVHYEISNFSVKGFHSRHNLSYWQQKKYLGVGPSAHSYNLVERQWNIAHNNKYMNAIEKDTVPLEVETLTENDKFNDYVLTSLRTMWGLDLNYVRNVFGDRLYAFCCREAEKYKKSDHVKVENRHAILTEKGVFVSNDIMSDFFWIEDE